MNEPRSSVVLILTCTDAASTQVHFEPEGAEHELKQGDHFKVEISGPGDGKVEVGHYPGGLSVWAWRGANTRAWNRAGEELRL